jgi:phosphatidylinositol 3-kinase
LAHLKLARGTRLARADRDLKPLTSELQQLNRIIASPPTLKLATSDAALLWKFRYYLQANPRALPKLLSTVDFSSAGETERVLSLMSSWEPVAIADALQLLSTSFPHQSVRQYAVARLEAASDDELNDYLLQLVQAMPVDEAEVCCCCCLLLLLLLFVVVVVVVVVCLFVCLFVVSLTCFGCKGIGG